MGAGGDREDLTGAERAALDAHVGTLEADGTNTLARGAVVFNLVAPLLELALARPRALWVLLPAHAVSLLFLWLRTAAGDARSFGNQAFGCAAQAAIVLSYAVLLRMSLLEPDPWTLYTVLGTTVLICAMWAVVLTLPGGRWPVCMGAAYAALGFWVWLVVPGGLAMAVIMTFAQAAAVAHRYAHSRRVRAEASFELAIVRHSIAAQNARIERELALAREVQDSLLPPAELALGGRYAARFFIERDAQVGGDWIAARELSDGRSVLLICDAAGKGAQAAIVVHALQSLWAQALAKPEFDAAAWLARANACLVKMGRRKRHAATLGLAVLGPDSVTYWSAGHLPLLLYEPSDSGGAVRPLAAPGDMLGVSADFVVEPVAAALPPRFRGTLVLATDGVITSFKQRAAGYVGTLVRDVTARGTEALRAIPVADDKALILVARATDAV